jgi:large subunit ribosomal protein L25
MASQFTLSPIEAKTKGEVKRLRKAGFVPVSIQHKGMPTQHYQLEARLLDEFIHQHGEAALLDLTIGPGQQRQRAIVHDVQRDPLTHRLLQVTFQQVRQDDTLKVHVPLVFHGEPTEVRHGTAIVQHPLDRLEIECAPGDLPEHIAVDISSMHVGDVLRVFNLSANPHFKVLTPAESVVASVTSILARVTAEEAEAATTEAEPEVAAE